VKIIVLGAGVIGVTSAWYLRTGHEVTCWIANPKPGWRPRSPTVARSRPARRALGKPSDSQAVALVGREDARCVSRARRLAQWNGDCAFFSNACRRFERNCRPCGLAVYSPIAARPARADRVPMTSSARHPAFATDKEFAELARHAEAMRALASTAGQVGRRMPADRACAPAFRGSRRRGVYTPQMNPETRIALRRVARSVQSRSHSATDGGRGDRATGRRDPSAGGERLLAMPTCRAGKFTAPCY